MQEDPLKKLVVNSLKKAKIEIDGPNPWDIQVRDNRFYSRVIKDRSIGLGEAYMDGWIEIDAIDELIGRLYTSGVGQDRNLTALSGKEIWTLLKSVLGNPQTYFRSFEVGKRHYDLGNDLFQTMLDKRMVYSCAYWNKAKTLDEAQEAKLDLVCQKLHLKPGMTVLDIGCGWGGFAHYAAKNYGAKVVGITVSKEQCEWAKNYCKDFPVEIRFEDYRETKGLFDRVVSIGQFEHVGYKNYQTYMNHVHKLLQNDGLFLLHTIGINVSQYYAEPWVEKYIFPNSMIPSVVQIAKSFEGKFVMEDWHNFGFDYCKTLLAWYSNFENNWQKLLPKYGQKFYRMWRFYLLGCAGAFKTRSCHLWQVVLSKEGVDGGYSSVR